MSDNKKSNNMALWDSVKTTPTAHIQIDTSKTPPRKTVKAPIKKERATKEFGPFGSGWGVICGSERYERINIGDTVLLQYTANLFYIHNGVRGEFPIAAAIKEAYVTNGGKGYLKIDDEAVKKVRTDALTKGLSELGFNADIYQGLHDLGGYSEYADSLVYEAQTIEQETDSVKEAEEYAKWKESALLVYKDLKTNKAIETTFTSHVRKANKMGDTKAVKQFEEAKKARQEELKNG